MKYFIYVLMYIIHNYWVQWSKFLFMICDIGVQTPWKSVYTVISNWVLVVFPLVILCLNLNQGLSCAITQRASYLGYVAIRGYSTTIMLNWQVHFLYILKYSNSCIIEILLIQSDLMHSILKQTQSSKVMDENGQNSKLRKKMKLIMKQRCRPLEKSRSLWILLANQLKQRHQLVLQTLYKPWFELLIMVHRCQLKKQLHTLFGRGWYLTKDQVFYFTFTRHRGHYCIYCLCTFQFIYFFQEFLEGKKYILFFVFSGKFGF